MSSMRALVLEAKGIENFRLQNIPIPKPNENQVLVKVLATSVNPVDWKMASIGFFIPGYPIVLGCDVCGQVVEVGRNVHNVKLGDVIYAFNSLGSNVGGTFAEYSIVEGVGAHLKPPQITNEQAAALPVATLTAYLGLFFPGYLGLRENGPTSNEDNERTVLVWGATSAVGNCAVQLLVGAGYKVIATCSANNSDYVLSLGAERVFDYKDPNVIQQIKDHTHNRLKYVFDAVDDKKAFQVMPHDIDSIYASTNANPSNKQGLPEKTRYAGVSFGELYKNPEQLNFVMSRGPQFVHRLLNENKFKPLNLEMFEGIDRLLDAINRQKQGVSGVKVVVKI